MHYTLADIQPLPLSKSYKVIYQPPSLYFGARLEYFAGNDFCFVVLDIIPGLVGGSSGIMSIELPSVSSLPLGALLVRSSQVPPLAGVHGRPFSVSSSTDGIGSASGIWT